MPMGCSKGPPVLSGCLTLPGFELRVFLVDDVESAAAADNDTVALAPAGRLERILNFHNLSSWV